MIEGGVATLVQVSYKPAVLWGKRGASGNLESDFLFDLADNRRVYSLLSIRIKLQIGIEMAFLKTE